MEEGLFLNVEKLTLVENDLYFIFLKPLGTLLLFLQMHYWSIYGLCKLNYYLQVTFHA